MDTLSRNVDALIERRLIDSFEGLDPPFRSDPPPPAADPVDIVIPIHNAYDAVGACVTAALEHTDARHRLILVDDASDDPRIETFVHQLARRHAHVAARCNERNLGYLRTVNREIRCSTRDVVIMNSDAEVGPGWLDRLSRAAHSAANVGIACPLSDDATLVSIVDPERISGMDGPSRQTLCLRTYAGTYPRLPVAAGFCMYVRRALIDAIGDFDPAFDPGYGEETDYSFRAWQAGFEIVACTDALVTHRSAASFGRDGAIRRRRFLHERLMAARWPDYESIVREWWREWPLREQSERFSRLLDSHGRARALHIAHSLTRIGGTEIHARQLSRALATHLDVVLMAPEQTSRWADAAKLRSGRGWEERFVNSHYHVANQRILGVAADLADPGVERQFLRTVVGGAFRIVHFHSLLQWNSLMLPLLAKAAGAHVVLTLHSLESLCPDFTMVPPSAGSPCGQKIADARWGCTECLSPVRRVRTDLGTVPDMSSFLAARAALWRRVLLCADALIAPSKYVLDRIAAAHGEAIRERARVVPHGIGGGVRARKRNNASAVLRVGFLGGYARIKGAPLIFGVAERLTDAPVRFVVRGVQARHDLPATVPANVEWHPPFAPQDISRVLLDLDLLLLPAQVEETFSLLLSEALAAGVPVIASSRGALAERVDEGRNGWLRAPDDVDAWAALVRFLASPDGRTRLAAVADTCAALPVRTIEDNAEDCWEIYRQLLADSSPRSVGASITCAPNDASATRLRMRLARPRGPALPRWLEHDLPRDEAEAVSLRLHMTVLVRSHNRDLLAQTLESAREARAHAVLIVLVDDIDPLSIAVPDFATARTIAASDIASRTALHDGARDENADWFVCVDAGDRLRSTTTASLQRLLRDDADAIVTDLDLTDRKGRHYAATAQPAWDGWRALGDSAYPFALFVSAAFMRTVGGWAAPISSCRLAMVLELRRRQARVASISRVLMHIADANLSPRHCQAAHDESLRLVRSALDREQRGWHVGDRRGVPGWSLLPALTSTPSVAVRFWGREQIPPDAADDLCSQLHWPGLTACPKEFDASLAGIDHVLLWRYGAAPADASLLRSLAAWLQQPGITAVAPRRVAPDRTRLPRSYRFDGLSLQIDPDPQSDAGVLGEALMPCVAAIDAAFADCLLIRRDALSSSALDALAGPESIEAARVQRNWQCEGGTVLWIPDLTIHTTPAEAATHPRPIESTRLDARMPFRDAPRRPPVRARVRAGHSWSGLRKKHPRFAALTRDDWASSQYRVHLPLADLAANACIDPPIVWRVREEPAPGPFDLADEDIDGLIVHQCFDDRAIALLESTARTRAGPRVLIVDDLLTDIPAYNPARRRIYPDIERRLERALALSTCLVATSPGIAAEYGALAPKTIVIGNALPERLWPGTRPSAPPSKTDHRVRVGWAGAEQHAGDFSLIERLVQRRRDIQWVFMGAAPRGAREAGAEIHAHVPFLEYPRVLAALDLDIALAPLEDNAFNRCKSALKALEFGALGVPVIASNLPPYHDTPALLAGPLETEWESAIDVLASDAALRVARGTALRDWAFATHRPRHWRSAWKQALEIDHV